MRLLRDIADPPAELDGIGVDVAVLEPDMTGAWLELSRQHPERGGLSGTVRPEVAHDLAGPHGEAHVVNDAHAEKPPRKVASLQHGVIRHRIASRRIAYTAVHMC